MSGNIKNSPNAPARTPQSVVLPDPNLLNQLSPWNLRFQQLEPGRITTEVTAIEGRHINVLGMRTNLGLHQVGEAPKGRVTLGIPMSGGVPKWRDDAAEVGALISFGSGAEFDGVTRAGFHGLTFSLDAGYFDRICDRLGLPNEVRSRAFGVIDANTTSPRRAAILHSVSAMLNRAGRPFDAGFEDELTIALALSTTEDDARLTDRSTPAVRAVARRRALEAMRARASQAAPITAICAASGVGWRTLDRAFQEFFGIGPKAYFNMMRLCRVRQDLIAQGPDLLVHEAAARWGFTHMSQFAQDYRRLFHELPSKTRAHGRAMRLL